jgi:dTDP-4-amino-4,6-dideoxygalactose transaminase
MGTNGLMEIASLESTCQAYFGRQHAVAVGRGTWAISLILNAIGKKVHRKVIALPSFLCHTPITAVLWQGWQPLFVDVDLETGLVPDSEWAKAADMGAGAMMLVHLFGNPANPEFITKLCRERNIFLIEDACQAVGATIAGRLCGGFGDTSILSFGHTKTIDAGSGGMLLTDAPELASKVRVLNSSQCYASTQRYDELLKHAAQRFYERKDRLLTQPDDPSSVFSGMINAWLDLVPTPWTATSPSEISRKILHLPELAAERRRKFTLYADLFRNSQIVPLRMNPGAVPWRFCFRIPGIDSAHQAALSRALRAKNVHVSNWYVPTHWMAPEPYLKTGALNNTLQMYAEIFQLWLDPITDDARICANADAFLEVLAA